MQLKFDPVFGRAYGWVDGWVSRRSRSCCVTGLVEVLNINEKLDVEWIDGWMDDGSSAIH